jgi:hypothetical protein
MFHDYFKNNYIKKRQNKSALMIFSLVGGNLTPNQAVTLSITAVKKNNINNIIEKTEKVHFCTNFFPN